jgi:aspartate/glutamate racemase
LSGGTGPARPKVIGMLGGMSWESSAEYYRLANEFVRERLGGLHSARLVLASVDFAEVEHLQASGQWEAAGELLAGAACLGLRLALVNIFRCDAGASRPVCRSRSRS